MMPYIVGLVVGIAVGIGIMFMYSVCTLSSEADKRAEAMWRQYENSGKS